MSLTEQIAAHLRGVYFGGNWTAANLQEKLVGISWQQASKQVGSFHSIAALVYHMNYFVRATLEVLHGGPLNAKDKYSFDHPAVESPQDWDLLVRQTWTEAEDLARAIEQMPEAQLFEDFVAPQYGSFYRCLHGPIEHCHYHLGQIAIIKSLLAAQE